MLVIAFHWISIFAICSLIIISLQSQVLGGTQIPPVSTHWTIKPHCIWTMGLTDLCVATMGLTGPSTHLTMGLTGLLGRTF
jgi:hypothetical protein